MPFFFHAGRADPRRRHFEDDAKRRARQPGRGISAGRGGLCRGKPPVRREICPGKTKRKPFPPTVTVPNRHAEKQKTCKGAGVLFIGAGEARKNKLMTVRA